MVSSPWKGPQVSDGFTLSGQSSGVSRMLLSGGLLGSRAVSWPLGRAYSPPGAKPCPAPSGGVPIALPSTEEHLGMAGWEKQAHTRGCHTTCGDCRGQHFPAWDSARSWGQHLTALCRVWGSLRPAVWQVLTTR